jgi:uracil-DNA glycosylase
MESQTSLQTLLDFIEKNVYAAPTKGTLFNFYSGDNSILDQPEGFKIRQNNLRSYVRHFTSTPITLLLGEAPGHKGARFTGVPFTSEVQLLKGLLPFTGSRSSIKQRGLGEGSATMFLEGCKNIECFVWNAVPFHPHKLGNPLDNRRPDDHEIEYCLPILSKFLEILKPRYVGAIGKVSMEALTQLNRDYFPMRHPANGGKPDFIKDVEAFRASIIKDSAQV